MLTVYNNKKISENNIQKHVNYRLTWGVFYLLKKEIIYKRLLISIRETTERANSNISVFA